MRLDEQMRPGRGLLDLERGVGDGRQRLPLLRRGETISQRQQRLERSLALALEQARARQHVFHREGRAGLPQSRRAFVAQQHHRAFGLRVGRELIELRSGIRIEIGCRLSTEDRRQVVAYGHEPSGNEGMFVKGHP